MANIQQKNENLIPYGKYFIDSGKFLIDSKFFTQVKIPTNFTLIDSDTGEALNDFKRSSLEIPYKGHKIYVASVKKHLKQGYIDKVLIYFPAKIAGNDYFYGIQKYHVIDILEYLKNKGYLMFDSSNEIYKQIYVRDLDIKMDLKFSRDKKDELSEYNKELRRRFNGSDENFHIFNSEKQGFGISTYERTRATVAKPFLKFYDKTKELITKQQDFYISLPDPLRTEIQFNLIYRFEITLKDKDFFNKFAISNRLEDIHENLQEKWKEIGMYFLNTNFQMIIRKPKDTSELKPIERTLSLQMLRSIDNGISVNEIIKEYVDIQKNRLQRARMKLLFERIYYFTTNGKAMEVQDNYNMITKYDKIFGINQ